MRLISLILALAMIGGLVIYNKNSLLPGDKSGDKTVKQQARQIIDTAKQTGTDLQKQMEEQQKRIEQSGE